MFYHKTHMEFDGLQRHIEGYKFINVLPPHAPPRDSLLVARGAIAIPCHKYVIIGFALHFFTKNYIPEQYLEIHLSHGIKIGELCQIIVITTNC